MKNAGRRDKGFTLMEMLLVMGAGLVLLAITMSVFTSAMKSALFATDRAEMQQNIRAALNIITHDISMAGSQMPQSGIELVSGSKSGCKSNGCGSNAFPTGPDGSPVLYAIIPRPSADEHTDAISLAYPDTSLAQCPIASSVPSGSQITLGACMTSSVPEGYYAFNDEGYGVHEGDLFLLSAAGVSGYAVGVVTNVGKKDGKIQFSASDDLNMNQPSASKGNIGTLLGKAAAASAAVTATRLLLITYYLQAVDGPDGLTGTADDSYRLMRQVNSETAVPVAENIASLQLTYDVYDSSSASTASNRRDANGTPSLIRKANIAIEAKSPSRKAVSKTQYMRLATTVEPRNLVYQNAYEFKGN